MTVEITQGMIDNAEIRGVPVNNFNESIHNWSLKQYTTKEAQQQQVTDENGDPVTDENGNPIFETVYVEVVKHKITGFSAKPPITVELTKYSTDNELVTINGYPSEPVNAVYGNPAKGDSLTLECDIVDSQGAVITAINSGSAWRMPIEKILANGTAIDETKLDTTIVNGHVTATLTGFPSGGTWYISKERVNQSLDEIGAGWHINMINMKFWVKE